MQAISSNFQHGQQTSLQPLQQVFSVCQQTYPACAYTYWVKVAQMSAMPPIIQPNWKSEYSHAYSQWREATQMSAMPQIIQARCSSEYAHAHS